MRRHYEQVGFIPRPRLDAYSAAEQIDIEYENGAPCGFLVWGNGWPVLKVYQACIQYDAQRRKHGYALVRRLILRASEQGYEAISCWCAEGLESNEFWRSCGFQWSGQRDKGGRRKRKHNRWVMYLPNPLQPNLIREAVRPQESQR